MKTNYKEATYIKFHKALFMGVVLGQVACGYALGIAGFAVLEAQEKLGLNVFWIGLLGAGTLIGLFGSLFVGNLADKIGRRKLLLADMVIFTIISILQMFTSNVVVLLILRIGLGLCIAVDYSVGGTTISEWLPEKDSARLVSQFIIYWTVGYVASFFAGLVMGNMHADYHIIFVTSAIPGLIVAVLRFMVNVPESPAWLSTVGKTDEANRLIQEKVGGEYHIVEEKKEVQEKVSIAELFNKKYCKRTLIGGVFYACQVFPYYGVSIFLPILVTQLNMGGENTSSILYDIFCLAGSFVGVYICNKVSRRGFLYSTFYIAGISLAVMILGKNAPMIITLVSFCVYAMMMSVASVIQYPYPPELFDNRVRGTGVGIVIAFSRIGAAAGTFLLPILVENIGVYGALTVCCVVLFIGGIACQIFAPETSPKYVKIESKSVEA